jgi:hypothetical protein
MKLSKTKAKTADATRAVLTGASVEKPAELIPFTHAIREAKQILNNESKGQWRLGELADTIKPEYGEGTLAKFAQAIGLTTSTLSRYREVYRAWKHFSAPGRELPSYSVARALEAVPNRADFVSDKPHMTKREAERIARDYNRNHQGGKEDDDEKKKKSGRARNYANRLLEVLEDVDVTPWGQQPGLAEILRRVVAAAAKAADALEALEKPNQADPKSAKPSKAA